jgi:hypothetical protein
MVLSSNYEREREKGRQVMELADGEGGFVPWLGLFIGVTG